MSQTTTPDIEDLFSSSEIELLIEGLALLLDRKTEALQGIRGSALQPAGQPFQPHDFGIPQIEGLIARLGGE
ncbi:MAG: hypothetical protein V3V71_15770 [Roseateles sp.]|jgi:hypothetical protein|nr:MAG: hypothetical protein EKK53_05885 [Burkholderiales bacterium]